MYRKPRLSVRSACNLGLRFGVLRADRVAPFGRPDRGGDCQARIPCPARVAPASARDRKIAFKSNWRCRSERPANLRVVDKINFNDKSWQLEVGLIATDIPEHWASDRSARTPLSPHSYRPPPAARRDRFRPTAPSRSRLTIAAVGADPRGYATLGASSNRLAASATPEPVNSWCRFSTLVGTGHRNCPVILSRTCRPPLPQPESAQGQGDGNRNECRRGQTGRN